MSRPNTAVEWKLSVPYETALKVEMRLVHPETRRPIYGARSKIINALLLRWLQEQELLDQQKQKVA